MLTVAMTFDYELFFGTNKGSYREVLFDPTAGLIELLSEENVSATFFADICSVFQANRYDEYEYVDGFKKQLQYMSKTNQDVQLHIHSHWLKSRYDGKTWQFSNEAYRIHELGFSDNIYNADVLIRDGIKYLNEAIKPWNSQYECIAYRAGGFCIQPHRDLVIALCNNGIKIDSSIAPHLKSNDMAHSYDYCRNNLQCNWYLSPDREWWEDGKDDTIRLYEVPVAVMDKNPLKFSAKRMISPEKIKLCLEEIRGTYINSNNIKAENNIIGRINNTWNYISGYNAISMDAYTAEFIIEQIKRYYHKNQCNKRNAYIAMIGHPKLVSRNYLKNLRELIDNLKKIDGIKIKSIIEIWEEVKSNE